MLRKFRLRQKNGFLIKKKSVKASERRQWGCSSVFNAKPRIIKYRDYKLFDKMRLGKIWLGSYSLTMCSLAI